MEDFSSKLLSFEKRHDRVFVEDQLRHHLVECLELLEKWDPHLCNELIDIIQITQVFLRNNLKTTDIDRTHRDALARLGDDKAPLSKALEHALADSLDLMDLGDNYLYAKLIDLIHTSKSYLLVTLQPDEIDEAYKKRFEKFMSKLRLD